MTAAILTVLLTVASCLENYYQKLGFGPWAVVEKKREVMLEGYSHPDHVYSIVSPLRG